MKMKPHAAASANTCLKEHKVDAYVADQMSATIEKEKTGAIEIRPFSKDKFTYHQEDDCYTCPYGEKLFPVEKHITKIKTYIRHEVQYLCRSCPACPHQKKSVKSLGFLNIIHVGKRWTKKL
jgi:hypothetical protein